MPTDWSHPARVQHQVEPLLADGGLVATTTDCLRVSENLILNSAGRLSLRLNTSSLLFRRSDVVTKIGYFNEVRKAADSEYIRRIESTFGTEAIKHLTEKAYALVRLGSTSLSSDDFRPGWIHPARLAYRSAYGLWHRKIRAGFANPYLAKAPTTRPFPAPPRFRVGNQERVDRDSFDVILAGDWRRAGWLQRSMIEEIRSLLRHGHRVAIMQLESYRLMARLQLALCDPIQELINAGTVGQVVPSDDVTTSMLVIRCPQVLQFAGRSRSGVRATQIMMVANDAPTDPTAALLARRMRPGCAGHLRSRAHVVPLRSAGPGRTRSVAGPRSAHSVGYARDH